MTYNITATARGIPVGFGVSRETFGEALSAAVESYEKGYEVRVTDQRTGQVYTEANLLQARDRLRRSTRHA